MGIYYKTYIPRYRDFTRDLPSALMLEAIKKNDLGKLVTDQELKTLQELWGETYEYAQDTLNEDAREFTEKVNQTTEFYKNNPGNWEEANKMIGELSQEAFDKTHRGQMYKATRSYKEFLDNANKAKDFAKKNNQDDDFGLLYQTNYLKVKKEFFDKKADKSNYGDVLLAKSSELDWTIPKKIDINQYIDELASSGKGFEYNGVKYKYDNVSGNWIVTSGGEKRIVDDDQVRQAVYGWILSSPDIQNYYKWRYAKERELWDYTGANKEQVAKSLAYRFFNANAYKTIVADDKGNKTKVFNGVVYNGQKFNNFEDYWNALTDGGKNIDKAYEITTNPMYRMQALTAESAEAFVEKYSYKRTNSFSSKKANPFSLITHKEQERRKTISHREKERRKTMKYKQDLEKNKNVIAAVNVETRTLLNSDEFNYNNIEQSIVQYNNDIREIKNKLNDPTLSDKDKKLLQARLRQKQAALDRLSRVKNTASHQALMYGKENGYISEDDIKAYNTVRAKGETKYKFTVDGQNYIYDFANNKIYTVDNNGELKEVNKTKVVDGSGYLGIDVEDNWEYLIRKSGDQTLQGIWNYKKYTSSDTFQEKRSEYVDSMRNELVYDTPELTFTFDEKDPEQLQIANIAVYGLISKYKDGSFALVDPYMNEVVLDENGKHAKVDGENIIGTIIANMQVKGISDKDLTKYIVPYSIEDVGTHRKQKYKLNWDKIIEDGLYDKKPKKKIEGFYDEDNSIFAIEVTDDDGTLKHAQDMYYQLIIKTKDGDRPGADPNYISDDAYRYAIDAVVGNSANGIVEEAFSKATDNITSKAYETEDGYYSSSTVIAAGDNGYIDLVKKTRKVKEGILDREYIIREYNEAGEVVNTYKYSNEATAKEAAIRLVSNKFNYPTINYYNIPQK